MKVCVILEMLVFYFQRTLAWINQNRKSWIVSPLGSSPGNKRSVSSSWYQNPPWLEYSVKGEAAYFPCRKFKAHHHDASFTVKGFKDWKHAYKRTRVLANTALPRNILCVRNCGEKNKCASRLVRKSQLLSTKISWLVTDITWAPLLTLEQINK